MKYNTPIMSTLQIAHKYAGLKEWATLLDSVKKNNCVVSVTSENNTASSDKDGIISFLLLGVKPNRVYRLTLLGEKEDILNVVRRNKNSFFAKKPLK